MYTKIMFFIVFLLKPYPVYTFTACVLVNGLTKPSEKRFWTGVSFRERFWPKSNNPNGWECPELPFGRLWEDWAPKA
jgi:hypothetical protein